MKKWNLIIPVSPGTGRQNARYAGGMRLSKGYKGFLGSVKAAVIASGIPRPLPITCVGVSVTAYWPRQHRQPPLVGIPFGDIDAPLKGLLDGLEKAGVYTDDGCVVTLEAQKKIDPGYPRLEVAFWDMEEVRESPSFVEDALLSASSHVYRQVTAGKHEQDRADAQQWIGEFDRVVAALRIKRA